MDEKCTPSTHLIGSLWLQVESAGSLGGLVHDVYAISQFVGGGGEGTNVDHTLLGRVVVSFS